MTNDEGKEFLDILMDAAGRVVDSRTNQLVHMEPATVRFLLGTFVYVRPISDISIPRVQTPSTINDLDDGDVKLPNISGSRLIFGDKVDVMYTGSIEFGFVVHKYGESSGYGLEYRGYASAVSTNMNDITEAGVYYIDGTTFTNAPSPSDWSYMFVLESTGNRQISQIIFRMASGRTYFWARTYSGSPLAWGTWTHPLQTANGDLGGTGSRINVAPDGISVATSTWTTVATLNLTPGRWWISANARWNSISGTTMTGRRKAFLSTTADSSSGSAGMIFNDCRSAVPDDVTFCAVSGPYNVSANTPIYLNTWHNQGTAVTTLGRIYAIRIS